MSGLVSAEEDVKQMMDNLIVDMIGATVMSVVGYVSIKYRYRKGWVAEMVVKRAVMVVAST